MQPHIFTSVFRPSNLTAFSITIR